MPSAALPFSPMTSAPLSPDETRRILTLSRRDRKAAEKAVASLSLEAQMALVCETPLAQRAEMLGLLPTPESVIPLIPEAELCFTVKAIGLADAVWILDHVTPEQLTASIDLDAWNGHEPDLQALSGWIDAIAQTSRTSLMHALHALDPELLVLVLRSRITVEQKPTGDEDWQVPEGTQTLEGQFYYGALADNDDLAPITALLQALFEEAYWTYFRMMQGVSWELESINQEWALRWRSGRLEDLGFPSWDEAMQVYKFLAPAERAQIADDVRPLDVAHWHLPVWIPQLPEARSGRHRIFEAIAQLDDDERLASFYALVAVANKIAVADRLPLGDAESIPRAIEKAARWIDAGLAHVASENGMSDPEALRRVSMERLFRVGANLDPESARP